MSSLRERIALRDRFLNRLLKATNERGRRQELVTLPGGSTDLGWVIFERTVMHDEVNSARAEIGQPPIALVAVERAESLAVGHVDYAAKFALYCAELVSAPANVR